MFGAANRPRKTAFPLPLADARSSVPNGDRQGAVFPQPAKLAFALAALAISCFAAKKPVTIDAVANHTATLAGRAAGAIAWAPDGSGFTVNEKGALSLFDVKTGRERELVKFSALEAAAVKAPPEPVFDWTNRNVGENNVQWFSDARRLLIAAAGDLFVYDLRKGSFEALTQTAEIERDPKLSPDSKSVSFRRGHDLWVENIATKHATQLTHDGSGTLLNGELDWVYPEELYLDTAHWWSPDGQSIAYLQFDVNREPIYPQVSLLNARGLLEPERYPKAGDPNAEVRLGIVPAAGGATKWMNLGDPRDFLFARVAWTPACREVLVERLNRVQNKLDLLLADTATGAAHVMLHEEDPKWINIKDAPRFLGKGDRFLWESERTGFFHLYVYGVDGKLVKQLTDGAWEVDRIAGVANNRIFFTSTEQSPLERQLYSVSLDGTDKRLISKGEGTHAVSLAPNGAYYVDDYSGLATPPRSDIVNADGIAVQTFRKAETSESDEYEILPTEIVNVKTADGTTLYARMIKPAGFRPDVKYPAVVMVYGGPGVQSIRNTWQGLTWDQALAHKGFLVWQLDNRGSSGRGHAFESPIYRNMGAQELADQKEGIQYLVSQGFVDPKRIGLYGWSYGGYMTLYTVTNAPGLIRAAIAGAPVTSWRNYDSIYTERYMGLPEENADAYKTTSPQTKAAGLDGTKLMIVHNIEDDNVHFQNTMQMADALEKAGKQFYMLVYPQKTHGVTGPARKQLLEETTAFFEENLK